MVKKYGGKEEDWQHAKGIAELISADDEYEYESITAEVHWSQCEGIGMFDFFVKVEL